MLRSANDAAALSARNAPGTANGRVAPQVDGCGVIPSLRGIRRFSPPGFASGDKGMGILLTNFSAKSIIKAAYHALNAILGVVE